MTTRYINTKYTLLDRAKETIDGKTMLPFFRVMNELVDDFFMDVPFIFANMGLAHKFTRDTGMVTSTRRTFYSGVVSSKLNKQVVVEQLALMERRREIDEDEIDTLGKSEGQAKLRQEDESHIRKLGEDIVYNFFNDTSNSGSEHIDGLFKRLDALNPDGLNNVRSNGHSGTGTSILIVEWNVDKTGGAFGIIPPGWVRNSDFGVAARNKFKEKVGDVDNAAAVYYAYVAQFKAWMGLGIANNRKMARLANVNSTIGGSKSFNDGGVNNLIQILNDGRFDRNRTRMYVNTTIKSQMDIYAKDKSNVLWSTQEVFGRPVTVFQSNIPVRVLDTTIISNSQTAVTA